MAPGSWLLLVCLAARPASAALYAAAGKAEITPDTNKTVWLAGFGSSGRRARGVRDPLYARAVVVSDGKRTVAVVAVDLIGLFYEDVLEARRRLGWTGPGQYLFVAATHTHSGPDTLGMWGPAIGISGVNSKYRDRVLGAIVALVRELSGRLVEAELAYANVIVDPARLCRDSRDPVVIDPELDAIRLSERRTKAPIATVLRYSCHPEVLWGQNDLVSADYPGAACARIEEGNGACVFLSGSIGGLLTPDVEHGQGSAHEFTESERIGRVLAERALAALKRAPVLRSASVSFSSAVVRVPVENSRYLLLLRNLAFGHKLYDSDGRPLSRQRAVWLSLRHLLRFPLPERLRPWVESEVSLLRLAGVSILGLPGEAFPELAIGGYDGRYRFGHPLISPANPNPPELARAPKGPYLRQLLPERAMIVGLANDELGYLVAEYDFQVAPTRTMTPKPPGTHYEETNSIGPRATPIVIGAARHLLGLQ